MLTTEPGKPLLDPAAPQAKVENSAPSITVERTAAKPRGLMSTDGEMKLARGVVDQSGERAALPDPLDHCFDLVGFANVADVLFHRAAMRSRRGQTLPRQIEHRRSATADVNRRAMGAERARQLLAEAGSSAVMRMRLPRSTSSRNGLWGVELVISVSSRWVCRPSPLGRLLAWKSANIFRPMMCLSPRWSPRRS